MLRRLAALSSLGAALIHLGVTREHFAVWWVYGIFFFTLAAFQGAWALLVWRGGDRRWWTLGLAVNLAVVVLWLVTRTTGLPVGPDAGTPEPVGFADVAASVLELAVVALGAAVLARAGDGRSVPRRARVVITAVVTAGVLAVSGAALAGPAEHGEGSHYSTSDESGGHDHDESDASHGERHDMAQCA